MECYWVLGQRIDFLATGATTGGHYSLFHVFIPAGPPGPLPHTHRDADEFFFVVEGRVEVLFEDAWRPLGPGQFLHVPRGTLHTFRNATTDAARMLSGFVPSGFERFFQDFGHSARLEDVEPLPVQDAEIQRLTAMASEYDMELGPVHEPRVHQPPPEKSATTSSSIANDGRHSTRARDAAM